MNDDLNKMFKNLFPPLEDPEDSYLKLGTKVTLIKALPPGYSIGDQCKIDGHTSSNKFYILKALTGKYKGCRVNLDTSWFTVNE